MNAIPGRWKVDLTTMVCKNVFTEMEVSFERRSNGFSWKINYMPMDLLAKYASMPDGEKVIKFTVMDAYEVFLRAYNNKNDTKTAA